MRTSQQHVVPRAAQLARTKLLHQLGFDPTNACDAVDWLENEQSDLGIRRGRQNLIGDIGDQAFGCVTRLAAESFPCR